MSNSFYSMLSRETWNPLSGYSKNPGECDHCDAERRRHLPGLPGNVGREFTNCAAAGLLQPISWRRPRIIVVCSMSDLFHADVPESVLDDTFAVMAIAYRHTFQVLSKHADRLHAYLSDKHRACAVLERAEKMARAAMARDGRIDAAWVFTWPLENVWVGVSAGTQGTADERLPLLMQSPAAKRWISLEPLLAPVDLQATPAGAVLRCHAEKVGLAPVPGLDWVVLGGETGARARPMHPAWARAVRDQCAATDTPFFFKHHGEWAVTDSMDCMMVRKDGKVYTPDRPRKAENALDCTDSHWLCMAKVGWPVAGDLLDGAKHKEMPLGCETITRPDVLEQIDSMGLLEGVPRPDALDLRVATLGLLESCPRRPAARRRPTIPTPVVLDDEPNDPL